MNKLFTLLLLAFLLFSGTLAYSQRSLEVTIGAGATAIDLDQQVAKDEIRGTSITDWGVANYSISAQYHFLPLGNVTLGAELFYQHMYWYSVRVPYGDFSIYRTYEVGVTKLTPVFRFNPNEQFTFDAGPSVLLFSDGVNVGAMASANYTIPLTDRMAIPIKFRVDINNGIVIHLPVSLNAGIRVNL